MKIGDIVTAYKKGYYEVIGIRRRWINKTHNTNYMQRAYCITGEENYNPDTCGEEFGALIDLKQLHDSKGNKVKEIPYTCDISFCKNAVDDINERIYEMNKEINQLKLIRDEYNKSSIL